MSSKRAVLREQKRRSTQQRNVLIGCAIGVVVLIAVALGLSALNTYNLSYVMTYEGNKIDVNDLRFCGIFATSEEDGKAQALDQLLTFLALDKAAKDNGMALTEEEKADVTSYSSGLKSYYQQNGMDLSFISTERMAELLGLDTLRTQLLEKYTADYTVDETDYQRRLVDYKQNERVDYIDTQVNYIVCSSKESIDNAKLDLDAGAEFNDVLTRYSEYYNEETGIDTYALTNLGLDNETAEKILDLGVGGVTDVIVMGDSLYGIFRVDSIANPTDEEINNKFSEKYTAEKKEALFEEIVKGWKDSANYTLNQKAYDAA